MLELWCCTSLTKGEGRGHETTSPSKLSKAHKALPVSPVTGALSLRGVNAGIVVLEYCEQRAGSVNETTSPKKHSEKCTALSLPLVMCTVSDPGVKVFQSYDKRVESEYISQQAQGGVCSSTSFSIDNCGAAAL